MQAYGIFEKLSRQIKSRKFAAASGWQSKKQAILNFACFSSA